MKTMLEVKPVSKLYKLKSFFDSSERHFQVSKIMKFECNSTVHGLWEKTVVNPSCMICFGENNNNNSNNN